MLHLSPLKGPFKTFRNNTETTVCCESNSKQSIGPQLGWGRRGLNSGFPQGLFLARMYIRPHGLARGPQRDLIEFIIIFLRAHPAAPLFFFAITLLCSCCALIFVRTKSIVVRHELWWALAAAGVPNI